MKKFIGIALASILITIASFAKDGKGIRNKVPIAAAPAVAAAKSEVEQVTTELKQAEQTKELNKQQAQEKKSLTLDEHQKQIAEIDKQIETLQAKRAELAAQHAEELVDLQKAAHEQEQADTKHVHTKEIGVVKAQANLELHGRGGERRLLGRPGEHWSEGSVSGAKETFDT